MAKKGKKAVKAASALEAAAAPDPAAEDTKQSDARPKAEAEAEAESPATVQPDAVSAAQGSLDQVAAENASLRAQLEELKLQLRAKDEELELMRAGAAHNAEESQAGKSEDLKVLQSRLRELREQQAHADAQRDTAWDQLKRVIEEVTNLADAPAAEA